MKKPLAVCAVFTVSVSLAAQSVNVSGIFDSNFTLITGGKELFWNVEEFANVRLNVKMGGFASAYGAFNLSAAAGRAAGALASGDDALSFSIGENFAAALELERLYIKLTGEGVDVDAGLMRLAFGYGQSFSPSDFLNTRNPLFPDARPSAILGAALSAYPSDSSKVLLFTAGPRNPFAAHGEGWTGGFSAEKHWEKASLQTLYAYNFGQNRHRGGVSFKLDWHIGLWLDLLYTHLEESRMTGLAASPGFDMSFLGGKCYIMIEYLFSGAASVTSFANSRSGFANHEYLSGVFMFHVDDYTNVILSAIAGLDDSSYLPGLTFEHELFQGFSISLNCRVPIDDDRLSDNGNYGEFGPARLGGKWIASAKARLRF